MEENTTVEILGFTHTVISNTKDLSFLPSTDNASTVLLDHSSSILIHSTPLFDLSNNSFSNITSNSTDIRGTLEVVLISIVAGFLSLITMGGNLLVIIAFKIDKQLQTISNCFLLSLAVADFTIGLVSMPLYTLYLLMDHWPLGSTFCDLWLSLDYTMSNASVANLLIICFDRYLSVTRPLTYRANRTPKKVGIMIGCAWVISAFLWTPWIFAWPHIEGRRTVPDTECYIQFLYTNPYITIATALAAFYIPISIMIILYFKIYRETEKRQKRIPMLQASKQFQTSKKSTCSTTDEDSSLFLRRGDISPEMDDLFDIEPPVARDSRSIWNRCCCCRMIDRDFEAPDDSSTSDPPGSPDVVPGVSGTQPYLSYRGNTSKYQNRNSSYMNGRPHRNSSFNNFNVPIPMYALEPEKSPVISPMTETTTVGSRCSNISSPTDNCTYQPVFPRHESRDSMYTIMIRFPSKDSGDGDCGKPSIKMYPEYSDKEEENGDEGLMMRRRHISDDSDYNDINEIKLDESSFVNRSKLTKQEKSLNKSDSMYSSSESIQALPQASIGLYRNSTKPLLPPPFGTPALGRRTRSFDAIKSASQARLALRVANRVKNQRVRRKRQERRQDRKAAKTLSAILLAFIITWSPYNIFAVVSTFCLTCIHPTLYAFGK